MLTELQHMGHLSSTALGSPKLYGFYLHVFHSPAAVFYQVRDCSVFFSQGMLRLCAGTKAQRSLSGISDLHHELLGPKVRRWLRHWFRLEAMGALTSAPFVSKKARHQQDSKISMTPRYSIYSIYVLACTWPVNRIWLLALTSFPFVHVTCRATCGLYRLMFLFPCVSWDALGIHRWLRQVALSACVRQPMIAGTPGLFFEGGGFRVSSLEVVTRNVLTILPGLAESMGWSTVSWRSLRWLVRWCRKCGRKLYSQFILLLRIQQAHGFHLPFGSLGPRHPTTASNQILTTTQNSVPDGLRLYDAAVSLKTEFVIMSLGGFKTRSKGYHGGHKSRFHDQNIGEIPTIVTYSD